MTVFLYTFKRFTRNKVNLVVMLVLTPVLLGAIFGFSGWGPATLSVGFVDHDDTPLTRQLVETISRGLQVTMLEEGDIRGALAEGRVDYVLVIDAGFTQEMLDNSKPSLRGYSIQESNMAMPAKIQVESFLGAAYNLAAAARGDEEAFYRGLESYGRGIFTVESKPLAVAGKSVGAALGGLGLLGMSMLVLATFSTMVLLKDKEDKTFYRLLTTPLSLKSYMLQSIVSFLLVLLVQAAVAFLVIRYLFDIYLGPNPLALYAVVAVFALMCVALGVAMSSLVRTVRQASAAAPLVVMPLCMLGGLFWPREMMPATLQRIGQILPTAWFMDAAQIVALGNPLADAWQELLILVGYTVVFFLLGTWRRTDVAR